MADVRRDRVVPGGPIEPAGLPATAVGIVVLVAQARQPVRRGPLLRAGLPGAGFLARLDAREVEVVRVQIERGLNAPVASSAGRLFDAAASLLGIRDVAEYEAQAAIELELLAEPGRHKPLASAIERRAGLLVYDQRPTLVELLECVAAGEPAPRLAARFQETVASVTQSFVREVGRETGLQTVVLSGGVFQNQWLMANVIRRLTRDGFSVHTNQRVPANDGGISYGQAAVAAARLAGAS